jgi:hypothetical protein
VKAKNKTGNKKQKETNGRKDEVTTVTKKEKKNVREKIHKGKKRRSNEWGICLFCHSETEREKPIR